MNQASISLDLAQSLSTIHGVPPVEISGQVIEISGPMIKAHLTGAALSDLVQIERRRDGRRGENLSVEKLHTSEPFLAQVVGFSKETTVLMPFGSTFDIIPGARVRVLAESQTVSLSHDLLGCVVDGLGRVLHREQPQSNAPSFLASLHNSPPKPLERARITEPFLTGIRAIDGFLTLGTGQRLSIFAEPGVGKSSLIAAIAQAGAADVNVIALIGERGREVNDLLFQTLDPETRGRTVMVVSTSDESAIMRKNAALTATRIAEFFRDSGRSVLLQLDSLTRLFRAYREVGLAAGEIPVRRGYPPSVFSELPQLIERAGKTAKGSITALYTVLLSSDIDEDPMVEEVKGLTDGHMVLRKELADAGHYPAIDILSSLSRLQSDVAAPELQTAAKTIRRALSRIKNEKELVSLGGTTDAELSRALRLEGAINNFLQQALHEKACQADIWAGMLNLSQKLSAE